MFPENKKDWEVNVQELDYQEIKKEENKMKEQFIKVNIPFWKVRLLSDAIRVEYQLGDDKKVYFFINSKYAFLNRSKDNNYYFTISLKRDWNYIYYFEDYKLLDADNQPLKDTIQLNGQELVNKITYWKDQWKKEAQKDNVI